MSFEMFWRSFPSEVFSYQDIASFLGGVKRRDKVAALVKQGKILRLKRGLYVFGDEWRKEPLNLEIVANLLYGPSCVSFETALFSYGMLTERPLVITSLAIGDSKKFQTPIGRFEYRAIDAEKFKVGVEYHNLGKTGCFVASKEKALADLVYKTKGIQTLAQLRFYLFEEMRIRLPKDLDFKKLEEIARVYRKRSVGMLCQLQNG